MDGSRGYRQCAVNSGVIISNAQSRLKCPGRHANNVVYSRRALMESESHWQSSGWGDVASEGRKGHFPGGRAWVTMWRLEWVTCFGGLHWREPRTWGKHVGYEELGQRGWCWQWEKSTADKVKGNYLSHMEGRHWRLKLKDRRDLKWKKVSGDNLVLIVGAQVVPILWRPLRYHILGHTEPSSLEALSWAVYSGESCAAAQKRQPELSNCSWEWGVRGGIQR